MNCWSNPADHYNQCQCQQIILSWPQSPLQSLQSMHTDPTDHCNHGSTLAFCPPDSWSMGRLCACDGLRRPKPEMCERCWGLKWSASLPISTGISKDSKGILTRCSMMKSYEFISLLKNMHEYVHLSSSRQRFVAWQIGGLTNQISPKKVW